MLRQYWSAKILAPILAIFALPACSKSETPADVVEQSDLSLGFVRIRASGAELDRLQEAAASVGWTEATRDGLDSVLLKVPPNYNPDRFGELLDAISKLRISNMGLQMLLPDGRVIDGDGNVEELK